MIKYRQELCEAVEKDLGREPFFTDAIEISAGIQGAEMYQYKLDGWAKDEELETPLTCTPAKSFIRYEPLGVVCIFAAWNFPLTLLVKPLLSAIAAGNCAVMKPSELAPHTSIVITKCLTEALD